VFRVRLSASPEQIAAAREVEGLYLQILDLPVMRRIC
jgi:hypothetical protein